METKEIFKTKIQFFKNCKSPNVEYTSTLENLLQAIRTGSKSKNKINEIRNLLSSGYSDDFSFKKSRDIYTYCIPSFFYSRRAESDIKYINGLVYIDIDLKQSELNQNEVKNQLSGCSHLVAAYNSISNSGVTAIYLIDNVSTKEEYIDVCTYISNNYIPKEIQKYVDKSCFELSRQTVFSYDKNIFVNLSPTPFRYEKSITTPIIQKSITTPIIQKSITTPIIEREEKKKVCGSDTFFHKLKFKSELEIYNEDCVYIPEGREFIECILPFNSDGSFKKVNPGSRNKVLSSYITNLVYLNPTNKKSIINVCMSINSNHFTSPLPDREIIDIVNKKITMYEKGVLRPIGSRLKFYWVNPQIEDKHTAYSKKRGKASMNKIDEFFGDEMLNMNCKITYKLISDKMGISEVTVKRIITEEQKNLMKEFNKQIKIKEIKK